jgi:hypothetical protein
MSSVTAEEFAAALADTEFSFVALFNPTNPRIGDRNQTFLKSQDYKDWDVEKKNAWKREVVAEIKKRGITVIGAPSGTPKSASASASSSASASTPKPSAKHSSKAKEKKSTGSSEGNDTLDLAILIAKLMETGLDPTTAAKAAKAAKAAIDAKN